MNLDTLKTAIDEAERFIYKAEEAYNEIVYNKEEVAHWLKDKSYARKTGVKRQAACKRASLDLTRSLSELRKS